MQISIISYVMLVLYVFGRDYVCVGYQSPVCVVPIGYVSSDRVGGTAWWWSMEEVVVWVWWGISSCMNVFFPPSWIVVVVLLYCGV